MKNAHFGLALMLPLLIVFGTCNIPTASADCTGNWCAVLINDSTNQGEIFIWGMPSGYFEQGGISPVGTAGYIKLPHQPYSGTSPDFVTIYAADILSGGGYGPLRLVAAFTAPSCDPSTGYQPASMTNTYHVSFGPSTTSTDNHDKRPCRPEGGCSGLPVWQVSEPYISLWLQDEPLGYQPAIGPRVSFGLAYKQRENTAGLNGNYFSIGKKWNFNWFSYVAQDSNGSNVVHFPDGLQTTFFGTYEYLSDTQLTGSTNAGFTLTYPDGSQIVYGLVVTNGSGSFVAAFMSEELNAQGQKTTFNYYAYTPADLPVIRLQNVVDGDGRTNLIYYGTNIIGTNLISQVVDPFGRTNSLAYDATGNLTNIIDVIGNASFLAYDTNGWVTNMITPYGTNSFQITDVMASTAAASSRSILVTQPDGGHQLFLYTNGAPVPTSYPTNQVASTSPLTNNFDNGNLDQRDSFHWGPLQYEDLSTNILASFTTNDFLKARMQHWLISTNAPCGDTLSVRRDPSPDKGGTVGGQVTWYDYGGKTNSQYEGTQDMPLYVAQVLPDGTTFFHRYDRNSFGNVLTNINTYTSNGSNALRTNIFEYNSTNGIDLIATTNANGVQVSSNAYNGFHQVTNNFDALNQLTVLTYNANQQLISVTTPSGLVITNIYGSDNFLATNYSFGPVGGGTVYFGTNIFTYADDLVQSQTDARGLVTSNIWDNLQRLVQTSYPDGTFVSNAYLYLDLVQTVDRLGFTNSFVYDNMRRLTYMTNALGNPTHYDYCPCGSLDFIQDALGNETQFYYDNQARRTNTVYADSYSVVNYYDLPGRLTNIVDSAGRSTTNWFNNQGLVFAVSNAMGQVQSSIFDILDRTTNATDANGVTITNTYDNLDRILTRGYPDTGVEQFVYSAFGLVAYTNQLNQFIHFGYDAALRKIVETNANLETNAFSYNPAGDLLTLTDGAGHTTSWNYDQFGMTTNKLDAASNVIFTYKYDADERMTNRNSITKGNTYYAYDAVGDLTNITYNVSPGISFAYDALSRPTNMVDAVGTTHYGYDQVGQLLSEDGPWNDDTVSYSYNNRLRASLNIQQPDADAWSQSYAYDGASRMTNITTPAGKFGYQYDGTRKLKVANLLFPNTAYYTNTYDSVARLLSTKLKNSGGTVLNSHAYTYDLGGERTNQTFTFGNTMAYGYDQIGQLTTALGQDPGGTNRLQEQLKYAYDTAHNLQTRTNNNLVETFNVNSVNELTTITRNTTNALTVAGTTTSQASSVTVNGLAAALYEDYTFASTNAFTITNGNNTFTAIASDSYGRGDTNAVTINLPATNSYSYDTNGNLLSDGTRAFDYDDENELIRVTVTNAWKSEFTYDGRLRRRIRKEFTWQYGAWIETNEVRYVYDGNVVVQERDTNNLPQVTYTRGKDLSGGLQGAGGIGGLLARRDRTTGQTTFYHADGNGNVTALISSAQYLVAKYLYDPYGNVLSESGPMAEANLYRFSSKETHGNSGLVYYLYRFYDANLQRWLNRDPIAESGGNNLYANCNNSLIGGVDYLGLWDTTGMTRAPGAGPNTVTFIGDHGRESYYAHDQSGPGGVMVFSDGTRVNVVAHPPDDGSPKPSYFYIGDGHGRCLAKGITPVSPEKKAASENAVFWNSALNDPNTKLAANLIMFFPFGEGELAFEGLELAGERLAARRAEKAAAKKLAQECNQAEIDAVRGAESNLDKLKDIENAQQKVRKGQYGDKQIDSIAKSKQNANKELRDIKNEFNNPE